MLKPAILFESKLQEQFALVSYDLKYQYYFPDGYCNQFTATTSTWNYHEFAVVNNKDELIGFISYCVDRRGSSISSLQAINFTNDIYTFGMSLAQAIDDVFMKYQFRKMTFCVYVGNPIEKNYDKMVEKYGGRIVGTYYEDSMLLDGDYHDKKIYELMRKDYVKNRRERQWI